MYKLAAKYEGLRVYGVPENCEELHMYKVPVKVPVLQWGRAHLDDINNIIIGFHNIFGAIGILTQSYNLTHTHTQSHHESKYRNLYVYYVGKLILEMKKK